MCGRYVAPDRSAIEQYWGIESSGEDFAARYNVAPEQGKPERYIPVIRHNDQGKPELCRMQWWLLPFWSKTRRIKYSTTNARMERIDTAASFREPLSRRRCLIPAIGWYEWQQRSDGKQPWYMHASDGKLLALAGVWDHWEGEGETVESCTIIVGPPNAVAAQVHDRMPLIVPDERQYAWLDRVMTDKQGALALLQPTLDEAIAAHPVSTRVNFVKNQGAELIQPIPG